MVLTSFYFLEYIILLGKYHICAVEVTALKFAVNEDSLCDHYIPNKIYAPGIQIIDFKNAGHNIQSGGVKIDLHVSFWCVVAGSDASLECLVSSEYIVA
jgi:hypothetical protein